MRTMKRNAAIAKIKGKKKKKGGTNKYSAGLMNANKAC